MANELVKEIGKAIATVAVDVAKLTPWGQIILGLIPSGSKASAVTTTVLGDLDSFARAVTTAETMITAINGDVSGLGSAKLTAARPYITNIVNNWLASSFPHQAVKDQTKFKNGVDQMTSGMADILSSLGD